MHCQPSKKLLQQTVLLAMNVENTLPKLRSVGLERCATDCSCSAEKTHSIDEVGC